MVAFSSHSNLDPELEAYFRESHLELFEQADFIGENNSQVVKSFEIRGKGFIIKRYLERGLRANFRSLMSISRAMNSFQKSASLAEIGVSTPDHLFVARHLGFLTGTSYLIMEKSSGIQLSDLIEDHSSSPIPDEVLTSVAKMIHEIHRAGLSHGDLHAGNIFVHSDSAVELIDLDNLHSNRRRIRKDIARILRSFGDYPELAGKLRNLLTQHK